MCRNNENFSPASSYAPPLKSPSEVCFVNFVFCSSNDQYIVVI